MKRLSTILLLLIAGASFAQQKTPQTVSSLNIQGVAKDQFKVDSLLYLPLTDTLKNPGRAGVIIVKASDLNAYLYNGTKWVGFGSAGDLALKLNISDTASMLSVYLRKADTTGKWVTAILKRAGTDSIFYVKGGAQVFAYKDSSGGSGTTPTLQQVLTAGNRITTSPQLIKGTGPTILQWDSLTNINWRHKGFWRVQADGGQQSLILTQTGITMTAADGVTVSTPSAGLFVLPYSFFSKPVLISDTLKLPNVTLKSMDTTGLKAAVFDASGNMFKMNWPTGGSGSSDSLKHLFVDTSTNRNNYVLTFDSANHKWILTAPGSGGGGSGTVTQVNSGYGLSGGPITTTGTLLVDSATLAAYFLRRKDSTLYATVTALATKQPTGNYITALTGDGTASGPGSAALTLTTVISAGSCTNCNLTYDAKGRLTVAGNGSGGTGGFNSNIGSGYRAAVPNTNNIKTFFPGYALVWDSISNANGLTISTDTTKISTITALNDSTDKFVYSTGFQTSGNTVYFFGHSYTFGTNASSPALRWSSLVAAGMGATEQNFGVAGKTLMLQNPKDYQGPNSMTQTLTDIPVKTFAMKALFFDFGLNDMGQTATDYSVANFKAAYDTVLNYAINTRGWFPSQIVIMGEEWIGTAGLNYYGTVTGNAAPTQTRAQQFVQAIKDEARKWGCKYVDNYYSILQNDTTLISGTGSVHPNDSGYAYIARRALQKLAVSTSTASSSTDSSLYVTTTRLATYVAAQAIANNPQLVQFTVGDNGEKTPANGVTTYQDSLLIGATGITVHQQGIGMPVGRARGGIYATFNDTTGTVTLHNGAFTDSAYFEMVGYFTTKAPQRTSDDSNFIAAVLGAGGSLTSLQEGYITTFFNTLKSNSLWDKIYAGHMLFLGSAAATKFNIKNAANTDAAYRITWHGTGTFASNGWTSDGSTGYGDFHFNPSLDATQDGLGLGAYVRGGSTGSTVYMMGNYDGSSITNDVGIDNSSGMFGGANSPLAQINSIIPAASTRLIYINRINSGSVKYYRDGAVVGTSSQTSATPYNGNIYLGCFNFGGTPSFFFGNRITFSIITDGSLNDTDEANLNTAINTFLTSWGINI